MKRFLINLIATTLLLIIAFSSFGFSCIDYDEVGKEYREKAQQRYDSYNMAYESVDVDIIGYEMAFSEYNLPQKLSENEKHMINGVVFSYSGRGQEDLDADYGGARDYYCGEIIISIYDEKDLAIREITVDKNYLSSKSEKVKQIYEACSNFEENQEYTCPTALLNFDGKVFIYCKGYRTKTASTYIGTGFPVLVYPTIFVFDLISEIVEYAGFMPLNKPDDFQKKNFVISKII